MRSKIDKEELTESYMDGKCEVNIYGTLDIELLARNIHKLLSKKGINILEEKTEGD
ncbi:hypothetical protein M3649_03410 [Ureibacillus chungkukjangi]|uniref:hypothetical protein n=1 Tax=Ureibacillus chungkukjangi TaxID=1202712 RepID=UPI00203C07CE|nr:hypothetical protein [Ureibacillus chungkukjangi]MCM3387177.1 hypothetical protein [Ureibacillus chungkukjangi]